ncbi:MAG: mannosyltransferase family protein [Patescibacteria group bacterium]
MKKVFLITLVWFLVINAFSLIALNRLNLEKDSAYQWIIDSDAKVEQQTWNPTVSHAQWDSFWLISVVDKGYQYTEGKLSNIVFFPAYPALIKLLSLIFGEYILSGWVVSAVFLFLAMLMFYKLVHEFHPKINPYYPIIFLLLFPTAFFLNAVYTESTFLFFSIATFFYLLKRKFWLAGLFGMFAALTRINGILLIIPFIWELYQHLRVSKKTKFTFLSSLLVPLGTAIFFFYHYIRFGDFLLFFKIQKMWGRGFSPDLAIFRFDNPQMIVNFALDVSFIIFGIIASIFVIRRIRTSYGLYTLAAIAVPLISGTIMGIGRFILVLFPLFILPATFKNEMSRYVWISISSGMLALYTLLFVNNYWAG